MIYRDEMGKTSTLIGKLSSMQDEKIQMELKDGIVKEIELKTVLKAVREIRFS